MNRSVFTGEKVSSVRLPAPLFIEIAIIIPVFAVCCCAVVQMLLTASQRSENENLYALSISSAQSYCEIYRAAPDAAAAAREIFGENIPDDRLKGDKYVLGLDKNGIYTDTTASMYAIIAQNKQYTDTGTVFTSSVQIIYDDGKFTAQASCYIPSPDYITVVSEEELYE